MLIPMSFRRIARFLFPNVGIPSVDAAAASINASLANLRVVQEFHEVEEGVRRGLAATHMAAAGYHEAEATRAARMAFRLGQFIA